MSEHSHSLTDRKHPYLPGIWLAAGFLGLASLVLLLRPAGITPSAVLENAAKTRLEKLTKLRGEQEQLLTSYGWVDKDKGIAHIPLDKAMQMILPKLRANDPHPAYAITTIIPSSITAAGAPLYPEIPIVTNAVAPLAVTNLLTATNPPAGNSAKAPAPAPTKKP